MNGIDRASASSKEESGLVRFEIGWQNPARLQIRDLTGCERNQFANAFMKSGRGAKSQKIRNFGTRVGLEIISVTEFMMSSEEPSARLARCLERTNVVLKINMPA